MKRFGFTIEKLVEKGGILISYIPKFDGIFFHFKGIFILYN